MLMHQKNTFNNDSLSFNRLSNGSGKDKRKLQPPPRPATDNRLDIRDEQYKFIAEKQQTLYKNHSMTALLFYIPVLLILLVLFAD